MPINNSRIWFLRATLIFLALILASPVGHARQSSAPSELRSLLAGLLDSKGKITPEEAVQIIARKLGRLKVKKSHLDFDRTEDRDGRSYHVVHGYEVVVDDPVTGDGHTATWGWFFVDRKSGAAYKWDLAEDKLTPF